MMVNNSLEVSCAPQLLSQSIQSQRRIDVFLCTLFLGDFSNGGCSCSRLSRLYAGVCYLATLIAQALGDAFWPLEYLKVGVLF